MNAAGDIVVVGGGPVGAAFALALHASGIQATVLESRGRDEVLSDTRPLALSHGSRLIFERLGVWDALLPATPIERIHVSQRGGFGRVELTAREEGLAALGYVVDYAQVASALSQAMLARGIAVELGARVTALGTTGTQTTVEYGGHARAARLVVVADGGAIEGLAPYKTVDYRQSAVTALVGTSLPHTRSAYERFTPGGPLALLPFGEAYALVWTTDPASAVRLCDAEPRAFLQELQREAGMRAGVFVSVKQRACYPLSLHYATDIAGTGVVRIGNAAQTLHPVAGQGFNLGLRDAWELAQIVRTTPVHELGAAVTANAQRARRRFDRYATMAATHGLVRLFSNDFFPLRAARGVGMTMLGCVPPLRDFVAQRMIFGARG